jgi:uncharacterized membrane protein YkoI
MLVGFLTDPGAGTLAADRDHDQERARRALEAGEILPLNEILHEVQQRYPGTVVELELNREHDRWVYEVELIAPDGRLLKLLIDAKSKQLLPEADD